MFTECSEANNAGTILAVEMAKYGQNASMLLSSFFSSFVDLTDGVSLAAKEAYNQGERQHWSRVCTLMLQHNSTCILDP
jgi:hypothetical protein